MLLHSSPSVHPHETRREVLPVASLVVYVMALILGGVIIEAIIRTAGGLILVLLARCSWACPTRLTRDLAEHQQAKGKRKYVDLLRRILELDRNYPVATHTPKEIPETVGTVRAISLRSNGSPCVICLDSMTLGALKRKLGCGHEFHARCVDKWLLRVSNTCPCCCEKVLRNVSSTFYDDKSEARWQLSFPYYLLKERTALQYQEAPSRV